MEAIFYKAAFSRDAIFRETTFSGKTDFEETAFTMKADFYRATFSKLGTFSKTNFNEKASFDETTFSGRAYFSEAIFRVTPDFSLTTFKKIVSFKKGKFLDALDVRSASFKEYADFRNTKIKRLSYDCSETPAIVEARVDFRNATISEAHFQDIFFEKDVDFSDVKFGSFIKEEDFPLFSNSDVNWRPFLKQLKEEVNSTEVNPGKRIQEKLDSSVWKMIEDLPEGREPDDKLKGKIINALNSILKSKDFYNKKYFERISLGDEANKLLEKGIKNLSNAKILLFNRFLIEAAYPGQVAALIPDFATIFKFVTFESNANFLKTVFSKGISFERVDFKKKANFIDADFSGNRRFILSYVKLNNLLIKLNQLPSLDFWVIKAEDKIKSSMDTERRKKEKKQEGEDVKGSIEKIKKEREEIESRERLEPLSQVLKGLEANFRKQNQLSDANEAYYHMKVAELKEARKEEKPWRRITKEAAWIFWGIPCGYGTKIWWILGWGIFLDVLFALVYSVKGELNRKSHSVKKHEFTFKLRFLDFPKQYLAQTDAFEIKNKPVRKFIDALRFSRVVLLKVGYRDTTISGKILWIIDYKYIVWLEWVLGFYLLAALAVTLSNTVPIVNKLITGVF